MNREEQIIELSKSKSNIHINRIDGLKDESWDNGYKQGYENGIIEGASWADTNPRTDIIHRDSLTFCRMLLVEKFHDIVKKCNTDKINEVQEINEAYDMIDTFDTICKFAGYLYNDKNGTYKFKD